MPTSRSTELPASVASTMTDAADAHRRLFDASISHLMLDVPADMRDELFTHWRYFLRASELMRQRGLGVIDEPSNPFDPLQFASHDRAA